MSGVRTEREGIFKGDDGNWYLPATRRPDGSWRKPIKVKQGYIPQEEVPTYESAGTKSAKDIPLVVGLSNEDVLEQQRRNISSGNQCTASSMSKAAKKNAKRKEKKKVQSESTYQAEQISRTIASIDSHEYHAQNDSLQNGNRNEILLDEAVRGKGQVESTALRSSPNSDNYLLDGIPSAEELLKKSRNLRKKLRQIYDLEKKIQDGVIDTPEKEQVEKISKKSSLQKELEEVELDMKLLDIS